MSGVFQSKPGALLAANYAVPVAPIAQSVGRLPSSNVTNITINLVERGTLYVDRVNKSICVAKLLKVAGKRAMVGLGLLTR